MENDDLENITEYPPPPPGMLQDFGPAEIPSPRRYERKWFGFRPAGALPLHGKWRFIGELLVVIMIEFILWTIYRYFSAPYIGEFGSIKFNIAQMIAQPTIGLIPIIIYWKVYRKEPGIPWKLNRKFIFSGIFYAA